MISIALFTGAIFFVQASLLIVAKPFYACFCTSCVACKMMQIIFV